MPVWMVFNYLISAQKNISLPEGLPTVEEAADTEPAVVLNTLPDSATELKAWFEGKAFQAIYFKNNIKEAYYLTAMELENNLQGSIKPFINFQNLMCAIN